MKAFLRRWKLRLVDALRHAWWMREAAGWGLYWKARLTRDTVERGSLLTRALGFAHSEWLEEQCIAEVNASPGMTDAALWSAVVRALPRYRDLVREKPMLDRSIVLKAPGENGEKGVLLMTFEYNWARLLLGLEEPAFRWLDAHYDLVLSTSWSPTDYAVLALALSRVRGTVWVQSCNYSEIARIERFHPRLKCLPTLPCDWINPALYAPLPAEQRTTDIVMVANWGEFKRHWDLFAALAKMPPQLKVTLIGQPEGGRSIATLQALARDFGVKQELEFVESVPIAEVARRQCAAKVSVIMTRREGCCVAAVESLFAGCALAMRDDAHVGPLAYIHAGTGARLRPTHLAEDLLALIERSAQLQPRAWAVAQVAGNVSHQRVNAVLREAALAAGCPWTVDILRPQWRPHPTFADPADQARMEPVYATLHDLAPGVFSRELRTESWR